MYFQKSPMEEHIFERESMLEENKQVTVLFQKDSGIQSKDPMRGS